MKCCYIDKECEADCISYDKNAFKKCNRLDTINNIDVNIGYLLEKLRDISDDIKNLNKIIKNKD